MYRKLRTCVISVITLLIIGCGGGGGGGGGSDSDQSAEEPSQQTKTIDQKIRDVDLPQEVHTHIKESDINQPLAEYVAKHFIYLPRLTESEKRDFIISLTSSQLCLEGKTGTEKFNIELAELLSVIYPGASGIRRYITEINSIGSYDISADEVQTTNCEG